MYRFMLMVVLFLFSLPMEAKETLLKLYRPFNQSAEQANLFVTTKTAGQCLEQSKRTIREDAWRCQADGQIYDPCFARQYGSQREVVCPQSPWVGQSVQIVLPQALDNRHHKSLDMSEAYPWMLELEQNLRCLPLEDAPVYQQLPVRYRCTDGSLLLGHIQRCDPLWKMLQKKGDKVERVDLIKAWF